jgi:lipopolysaccharide export system protein LptC
MNDMRPLRLLLLASLDRITVFLPVLLMGLLALSSYWLYRSTPVVTLDKAAEALRAEPDYFLKEFATRQYSSNGTLKNEIKGEIAFHFPIPDQIDIKNIRVVTVNDSGQTTSGTADHALSNKDGSDVQLIGRAYVIQSPKKAEPDAAPVEFSSEYLRIVKAEKISSNRPVLVTQGKDQFSAATLDYDINSKVLDLKGQVSLRLTPKKS